MKRPETATRTVSTTTKKSNNRKEKARLRLSCRRRALLLSALRICFVVNGDGARRLGHGVHVRLDGMGMVARRLE